MFDLDGTLLRISQSAFVNAYFAELSKVFVRMGMEPEASKKAVWAGTKAMIMNDGSKLNANKFWDMFSKTLNLSAEQRATVETACDRFYINEFDNVKEYVEPTSIPKRLVPALADRGYTIVLATNPLFPACAIETRLKWIGLRMEDFHLVTHYSNSTFCKPNLGYYKEIFSKIGKEPHECLMIGNNPAEDMCVSELGAKVYLVPDFLENEAGLEVSMFSSGSLEQIEDYLMNLVLHIRNN
jgi:FMN phosphatase YigB (HAD superfamily)